MIKRLGDMTLDELVEICKAHSCCRYCTLRDFCDNFEDDVTFILTNKVRNTKIRVETK